jgi:hypothetical protein
MKVPLDVYADKQYRTWPVNEQVIDILHKAVFAFVTGYFTDRWIQ